MNNQGYTGSFCGTIDEIPDIFVDNFTNVDKKAYFVSHCHTDHTVGLFYPNFLQELEARKIHIYMSQETAIVIECDVTSRGLMSAERLKKIIKPLELGETTVRIPKNGTESQYIRVTLIPAGHCFGSVMFLFRVSDKTILYTGDFRMNPNDVDKYGCLHENGNSVHIDTMYVDTTFICYTSEFPKRSEVMDGVISEIKNWLGLDGRRRVLIDTPATHGYEYVFIEIFKRLGEKVYVENKRWRVFCNYPDRIPGLTQEQTRIWAINQPRPRADYKDLKIRFSAMKWRDHTAEEDPIDVNKSTTESRSISVCFATHCSRSELLHFVSYLEPARVVGFPNPYSIGSSEKKDRSPYDGVTPSPKKRKMPIKVPENVIKNLFG